MIPMISNDFVIHLYFPSSISSNRLLRFSTLFALSLVQCSRSHSKLFTRIGIITSDKDNTRHVNCNYSEIVIILMDQNYCNVSINTMQLVSKLSSTFLNNYYPYLIVNTIIYQYCLLVKR